MGCVSSEAGNVVPFRRIAAQGLGGGRSGAKAGGFGTSLDRQARRRSDQRALLDAVYATGSLTVAAGDRDTKLTASRLLVYGFLLVEETSEAGGLRRLRPSEAIKAGTERPWRISKPAHAAGLAVTIPAIDGFLFETADLSA